MTASNNDRYSTKFDKNAIVWPKNEYKTMQCVQVASKNVSWKTAKITYIAGDFVDRSVGWENSVRSCLDRA